MKRIPIILFFATLLYGQPSFALQNDSVQISLLTCSPGNEIYSLFGHTAIRYKDISTGADIVFNYGMFSFNTPNFIWRFIKGETDYQLGATDYNQFAEEYEYYERGVSQQMLNLSAKEKEKLFTLLKINYYPENRVYRYNFLFDNCATRPRDKIEDCINGEIYYNNQKEKAQSFRDIIHEYTKQHLWERFGIDFCLGSKADKPITPRQKMFIPDYLQQSFASANIIDKNGNTRKLVVKTTSLIPNHAELFDNNRFHLFTPLQTSLLLFIITGGITIYGLKKKKILWGVDLLLFFLAGIAGCIIAFLACCSEHPAVSPNYLLFIFHPLHLLFLPFILYEAKKKRMSAYHLLNFMVLTLFILLWAVIPQRFDLAVLPLALSLLIRSASNLILAYKKK
ncbi:DUF4105 domain-containing protein [uncultured Bacteroides sp.]|uniref:lipoprotein N-acyltransferase Lnb n=1 Tax=uncultured Bacteroides sp. TaxID=162156 RepID=UPI002AA8D98A|nr:DUF4105 domain-containing protein [uncultured Bacteroides sp.]